MNVYSGIVHKSELQANSGDNPNAHQLINR